MIGAMVVLVALALPAAPPAHAAVATALLSVSSTWQTGFIPRFIITNPTTVSLTEWKLEFDLPASESILHSWSSTATGGFRGVLSGTYSPPVNCVLTGQSYCVRDDDCGYPRRTARSRMPNVARNAGSPTIGKILASRQC